MLCWVPVLVGFNNRYNWDVYLCLCWWTWWRLQWTRQWRWPLCRVHHRWLEHRASQSSVFYQQVRSSVGLHRLSLVLCQPQMLMVVERFLWQKSQPVVVLKLMTRFLQRIKNWDSSTVIWLCKWYDFSSSTTVIWLGIMFVLFVCC